MTFRNINILPLWALVVIACVIPACSKDSFSDIPAPEASPRPTMGITISLGASGKTTRTTRADDPLDGGFEQGAGLENYLGIDNNNYRIYFFDADDDTFIDAFKLLLRPTVVTTETGSGNTNYIYYQFRGEVPVNLPLRFKLVTLFNWPDYPEIISSDEEPVDGAYNLIPGVTTISDLYKHAKSKFTALSGNLSGDDPWLSKTGNHLIPFYGVREFNLRDYTDEIETKDDGSEQIRGNIYVDISKTGKGVATPLPLIRAMAKVELIFSDLSGLDLTFDKVSLTKVNPEGFCAPEATDYDDYDHGYSWESDFTQKVHLPWAEESTQKNSPTPKEGLAMSNSEDERLLQKWVAYVPEFLNGKEDECRIQIEMGDKTNYIYFSRNAKANGIRYNIERNNIYRFTITNMTTSLECEVDVQPFASVELTADYGLMRDERGDLMVIPDADGNFPEYFTKFMETHPNAYPKDRDTNDLLKMTEGDYYAFVIGEYDDLSNAEVWLKDSEGCRVLTNYSDISADDQGCNSRQVIYFFGTNQTEYSKDIHGFRRIYHFPNHWSIVLGPDEYTYFKNIENDTLYRVESWDEETHTGWIYAEDELSDDGLWKITTFRNITENGELGDEYIGPITIPNI